MYNGIGLQTARGSGTNGYVQTNKFFIRSRTGKVAPTTRGFEGDQGTGGITKKPNSDILEHDRKRQIELKLVVLEDKLIEQGFTDSEIAEKVEEARSTLEAAAASEKHGGPGALVLGDSKVSATQSHQVAARKEKQMETLRAALGIAKPSEADEQPADMSEDGLKNGGKWGQKPEHSFLDRDFSWKKSMVEDPKGERDDKKRGDKKLKNKKKEDVANDTKRKKLKKQKKSRRDDSDSDDSSMEDNTDSDSGKRKSKTSKNRRKSKKYSSDSYESSSEDEKYKKAHKRHDSDDDDTGKPHLKQVAKKLNTSRHDSDDSDTEMLHLKQTGERIQKSSRRHDSDDSDTEKPHLKQTEERIQKSSRRHDSDDSDAEKPHLKQAVERIQKSSRRHDSDDDSDFGKPHLKQAAEKTNKGGNWQTKVPDYDVDDRWKGDELDRKSSPKHIAHFKSDEERNFSREFTDKSKRRDHSDDFNLRRSEKGRGRRHDSDEDGDDLDTSYGRISPKKRTGGHPIKKKLDSSTDDDSSDSGSSDSDHKHGKAVKKDIVKGESPKNTGGRSSREERGLRSTVVGIEDRRQRNSDVYNSRGDTVDSSGYTSRAMMSNKRKLDDAVREEQEESKSRNRNVGEESGRNRLEKKLSKGEGDQKGRSYERREEGADQHRRHGRDELNQQQARGKLGEGEDEQGDGKSREREKQITRDHANMGERRYQRDEEGGDVYRKSEKDGEERGSHRRGRGEDDKRGSRSLERERKITKDEDDQGGRRYERGQEGVDVYKRSAKHDGDQERGSHRRVREEEPRGSRGLEREKQISRDEDDLGERRYRKDEEVGEAYKRSGNDDGAQERGIHKRGRDEEEARGGYNRDKEVDYSKKGRYDDNRSRERKRYERD